LFSLSWFHKLTKLNMLAFKNRPVSNYKLVFLFYYLFLLSKKPRRTLLMIPAIFAPRNVPSLMSVRIIGIGVAYLHKSVQLANQHICQPVCFGSARPTHRGHCPLTKLFVNLTACYQNSSKKL